VPPRYVYWTIIVDGQPTAFRSGSLEDIMPTFNRLKEKQPTAELKWFQNGQLWASRHDAQDFARARGERGRARDPRQSSGEGERPERAWNAKPDWKTRSTFKPKNDRGPGAGTRDQRPGDRPAWAPKDKSAIRPEPGSRTPNPGGKPEWKPKGSFTPAPRKSFGDPDEKPRSSWGDDDERPSSPSRSFDDRPAGQARSDRKPEWKPKGTFKPKEAGHSSGWGEKPGFKSRGPGSGIRDPHTDGKPAWAPKGKSTFRPDPGGKPAWSPKGDKPEWKSKGETPAWKGSSSPKPQASSRGEKPEWKPKGTFTPKEDGHKPSARDQARSSFKPKSYTPKVDDGRTRSSRVQSRNDKLDWKPKGAAPREGGPNSGFSRNAEGTERPEGKRKWVPKEEYKKSMGIEVKRDEKWRPGGVHRDPKQKYKDAKKAKWGRFKEAIRSRSAKPGGRKPKDE
jgi:hypothetical protein